MNCMQCGVSLPDGAKFCYKCGSPVPAIPGAGGMPTPPPPPPGAAASAGPGATILAPAGVQSLKCPNCGAPINPTFGDTVVSCEYCGSSVTLGGAGWKQINKHSILTAVVTDRNAALRSIHDFVDTGFMHRHDFEDSKIVEEKLQFVPFWIVPVSATTSYVYQDVAVGVGGTVASIAGAELLGSALGGRRGGGFLPIPVMTGPPVNPTRSDTFAGQFDFPVIAVKGMTQYQPKNYEFQLSDRTLFDKKAVPNGGALLNGDLGEAAAQQAARSYVTQLHAEMAHKRHHMVSRIETTAQVSDAELLHAPIFSFLLERKGARSMMLVDAHNGRVMPTVVA